MKKVLSRDLEMNVNIANIISAKDLEFLGLENSGHVLYYLACKCIEILISGKLTEIDSSKWLQEPLDY